MPEKHYKRHYWRLWNTVLRTPSIWPSWSSVHLYCKRKIVFRWGSYTSYDTPSCKYQQDTASFLTIYFGFTLLTRKKPTANMSNIFFQFLSNASWADRLRLMKSSTRYCETRLKKLSLYCFQQIKLFYVLSRQVAFDETLD